MYIETVGREDGTEEREQNLSFSFLVEKLGAEKPQI